LSTQLQVSSIQYDRTALYFTDGTAIEATQDVTAAGLGLAVLAGKVNAASPSLTDGKLAYLSLDTAGALRISGGGTGGTALVDDAAFSLGSSSGTPVGGTYQSTRDSVDDGDFGVFAMTAKRAQLVVIETPNGDSAMDETNDALRVNIVAGSASGTEYTEGDIDASITGSAILWEDTSDTLRAVSAAKPLPVDVKNSTLNIGTVTTLTTITNAVTVAQATASSLNCTEASAGAIKTAVEIMDDWDESDRAKVNLIAGQAGVTAGAGAVAVNTQRMTLASDDPAVTALQLIDNAISGSEMQVDVVAALPAGTNNIGDVDVLTIAAGATLIGDVALQPRTGNGYSMFKSIDLDESEEEIKAAAGNIVLIYAFNATAAVLYLKLYNATAASVTVGTTVPDVTLPIPANNDTDGAGFVIPIPPPGGSFTTAITAACTTGIADNDVGAPAANACTVFIVYK